MVAPTQQINGIGLDSYVRIQKESVFGTGVTNSMTDLKVLPDTSITAVNNVIEVANQVASRIKQTPDLEGRIRVEGSLSIDVDPTTIGRLLDLFLDQSAVAGDANTGYVHTYLAPVSGERVGNSLTIQQALGSALADQYNGCTINTMTLSSDNEGNLKCQFGIVGKTFTEDVARVSSWTYGAISAFNFGMTTCTLTFTGYTGYVQKVNSFELAIDLGYDTERYKLGSRSIEQPAFSKPITATLKINCDSDATLLEFARNQTAFKAELAIVHTTNAGAVSGKYEIDVEIPVLRFDPTTAIKNANERLTMDLTAMIYGGTTTGSGSTVVPFEIRCRDAVATYA